jgi:glucose/mannose-6-phosphate isomerase
MRKIILSFPKQFKTGMQLAKKVSLTDNFNKLLVCGMGGSALPGDLLKMLAKNFRLNFPVYIHRAYNLPYWADKEYLVICISYSGNTEETLSSFKEALRKNLRVIVITSGGKLAKLCKKHKIPLVKIPSGYPPRMALGLQFSALMQVLVNCRMVKDNLRIISALEKILKPKQLEKKGKILANKMKGKLPIIYSSYSKKELSRIWKIKFNENSKMPAFANYFPELNHNEMVGFDKISNDQCPISSFYVLILRDSADHPRILKRMNLTAKILKRKGINVEFIELLGRNDLVKTFSSILLSDWTSYYSALNYKVNPIPVKIVEEFKKQLK